MEKTFILLLVGIVFIISGCNVSSNLNNDFGSNLNNDLNNDKKTKVVCCKTFGYGAEMVECCQKYEWTDPDKCSISDELQITGGGKAIVEDSFCK